jgi:hypothetical protein
MILFLSFIFSWRFGRKNDYLGAKPYYSLQKKWKNIPNVISYISKTNTRKNIRKNMR